MPCTHDAHCMPLHMHCNTRLRCDEPARPALQADTAGKTGLVANLSIQGADVLACSYMTSLTVLTIQQRSDQVRLEAVSACTSSCLNDRAAPQPDALAASSAIKPELAACPVQAAVLMDRKLVLASMYPYKLLLLRRDRAEEMAVLDARHTQSPMQSTGMHAPVSYKQVPRGLCCCAAAASPAAAQHCRTCL